MSATMARQGGRVQLEQSDMRLAWNMAKMAKGGFSRTAIEEMQYMIKKPRADVREEKKRGVEFPRHNKVKPAMERHPAMLHQNHTAGYLPCQMALQRIHRHAGGAKGQVYVHPTNADSRLQSQRHYCPQHHPPQPVTLPELNVSKSSICRPDMCIQIHLFRVLNLLLPMHLPRMARTKQIFIQIC